MPTCRRRPIALPRRQRARALAGLSTMCNRIRQGGAQKGSLLTISVRGRAGHIDGSSDLTIMPPTSLHASQGLVAPHWSLSPSRVAPPNLRSP